MDKISRSFDFNFRRYRALGRYLLIQSKGIKAHIARVVAIGSLAIATNAQPSVSWQTPVSISGTSDVKTSGVYFGSWAPQDGSANTYPVNGVTFQGFSDLPGFTPGPTLDNGYDGFGSPNTADSNYSMLLQYGRFSNEGSTPATFSWSGMPPGNTYLIQLWVNDGRNIGQSRSETVTGACFSKEAVVYDDGQIMRGTDEIRQWIAGLFQKFQYVVTPTIVRGTTNGAVLTATIIGNFPGGHVSLDYHCRALGDKIEVMVILPTSVAK